MICNKELKRMSFLQEKHEDFHVEMEFLVLHVLTEVI